LDNDLCFLFTKHLMILKPQFIHTSDVIKKQPDTSSSLLIEQNSFWLFGIVVNCMTTLPTVLDKHWLSRTAHNALFSACCRAHRCLVCVCLFQLVRTAEEEYSADPCRRALLCCFCLLHIYPFRYYTKRRKKRISFCVWMTGVRKVGTLAFHQNSAAILLLLCQMRTEIYHIIITIINI